MLSVGKKSERVTYEDIALAVEAVRRLQDKLNYINEELIDAVIYEIKAAELRLSHLIRLARNQKRRCSR